MKLFVRGALAVALVAVAGAGDLRVYPAPQTDFAKYKTYSWTAPRLLSGQGFVDDDPALSPIIRKAVSAELFKKGLTEVPTGGHLQVVSIGLSAPAPQLQAVFVSHGWDYIWSRPGDLVTTTMNRYNRQGTLAVGLVDVATRKSIWVGVATDVLGKAPAGGSSIQKAAAGFFKNYPVLSPTR